MIVRFEKKRKKSVRSVRGHTTPTWHFLTGLQMSTIFTGPQIHGFPVQNPITQRNFHRTKIPPFWSKNLAAAILVAMDAFWIRNQKERVFFFSFFKIFWCYLYFLGNFIVLFFFFYVLRGWEVDVSLQDINFCYCC